MQRIFLASLVMCGAAFLAGCTPAEAPVQKDAIPQIPPGRSSQPAADAGGGGAMPAGRTPAAPK